ncbi:MAG: ComEC/Rec2 family competence protein [Bacteroidota bacterium]
MFSFKSIPFLKIIFPFIIGILFVLKFGLIKFTNFYFIINAFLFASLFFFNYHSKINNRFNKIACAISINLFLFFLAHISYYTYDARNSKTHYTNYINSSQQKLVIMVSEEPIMTENGLKIIAEIKNICQNNIWKNTFGKTVIYLIKNSNNSYQVGDYLYLKTKFHQINGPKNPKEFNYKKYLENKNIFNVIYTDQKHLINFHAKEIEENHLQIAEKIKSFIIKKLRNVNLSEDAFSICSALLVGFDDEIKKDVLNSFSHSGTLHVLSVSGLHTGVIYGFIIFLFSLFDKGNKFKILKCIVVIFSLFMFSAVTGFSPAVLRASLMLSLIIFGKTFQKENNSYNTLLVSAFIILLFNPLLITDAGFLLSYFAVFGILYLYPILDSFFYIENIILKWFLKSSLISISATLFTLPITLYFFHQFPIWFIFSNLFIIPLTLMIMLFSFLLLVLCKIVFLKTVLSLIINAGISLMIYISNLTDNNIYGYIDYIAFGILDVFFLSLTLFLLLIFINNKEFKYMVSVLIVCITWSSTKIISYYAQLKENELIVFHINRKSFFATRIGNLLYCDSSKLTKYEFNRSVKPYLLNYDHLNIIHSKKNKIKLNKISFVNLENQIQPNIKETINYVLISNNSLVNLNHFKSHNSIIISDCSNNFKTVNQLKKQCKNYRLKFYDVKEKGALIIKTK